MRVIIYGTGRRCDDLFDCQEQVDLGFLYYGIDVVGFSDGDPDKWGNTITYEGEHFIIKNIQKFPSGSYDNILVTSYKKYAEIREELAERGYEKERIFLIDTFFVSNPDLMMLGNGAYIDRQWKKLYRSKGYIGDFLKAEAYENIAVYGLGELTIRLADDFKAANVRIKYIVSSDINVPEELKSIPIYECGSVFPDADLMIVMILDDYLEIERGICEKNNIKVMFIQELLYRILKNAKGK